MRTYRITQKRLKQFLFFQHFYPGIEMGGKEFEELQFHAGKSSEDINHSHLHHDPNCCDTKLDHCLDFIRQSLMCHIDYSLYTLDWELGPSGNALLTHHAPQEKMCVNWGKLQQWMQSRSTSKQSLVSPSE